MSRPALDDGSIGESILDDLFHGCAIAAFVERMVIERTMPDPEATRRLAYQLYESELHQKNVAAGAERHVGKVVGERSNRSEPHHSCSDPTDAGRDPRELSDGHSNQATEPVKQKTGSSQSRRTQCALG